MAIPGFTAHAALYPSTATYRTPRHGTRHPSHPGAALTPAASGDFCGPADDPGECTFIVDCNGEILPTASIPCLLSDPTELLVCCKQPPSDEAQYRFPPEYWEKMYSVPVPSGWGPPS
jgi:hypothetical protein